MNEITRILVFDFDETLFRMPGYTDRFSVERLNPNLSFPTPYSFYDHSSSMDPEIHNIQLIGPVYEDWKAASEDSNARTILITHRTEELRPFAEHLLNMHGIVFDEMYFLGRMSEKIEILEKELSSFPNIKEVSVYEDSLEQLKKYQDFHYEYTTRLYKERYTSVGPEAFLENFRFLNMQFVDKSKVISLHEFSTGESRKIQLR
ncbi:Protein of unknown function DUF2410 [uncultured Caudovirales phage]|uniref:Swiss Army Knife RNA repair protein HAD domain-containing protein n=1 Tax=uncultured Caudovirales phage TaxID=2100421 RepID=A0A6J5Q1Q4_9CAUD|nr:Protein of unknown function DUF2410 [uncultured Caudovirales phage]CAB4193832.1 Protein of unknown function DUF2410 [uncultured Caudovirales phage]